MRWRTFTPGAIGVGVVLLLAGGLLCWFKLAVLEMPIVPSDPAGLWNVEAVITARGQARHGSVRLALPPTTSGQRIYDEHFAADRLPFSIRREGRRRTAVWAGSVKGTHRIVYGFRVQLSELETPVPAEGPEPSKKLLDEYAIATADFPLADPEVAAALERLGAVGEDPAAVLRLVFAFVSQEIGAASAATDDALLALAQREATELGRAKLLVTLLRASGIPARVVRGLHLVEGRHPDPRTWVEAWVKGSWVTMSSGADFFARRPIDFIAVHRGPEALLTSSGLDAVSYQVRALKERLRPEETAAAMLPSTEWLAAVSLYRLPVQAQSVLRLLLLFPLGVFILAIFRNLIGVQTYGTFMPVLIAFALRGTGLVAGLVLVALVLAIGALGRVLLDRLRLMIVPRLAIMLCVVVLCVTGLALAGMSMGEHDLYAGLLFPLVILTMLIERFSVTIVEEGPKSAAKGALFTTLVAVCIYPVMTSVFLSHVFFGFPELILCVMGLLVLLGGYTGYRLTDFWRFRALVATSAAATAAER